ncbi:MAG TPA: transposase, partial [Candidatus Sulfotelmatobacter sp.]|nr:transposase [Candidatus Sulfotelmatobacter sp.]
MKFRSIREIANCLGAHRTDRLHHLLACAPLSVESLQQSTQGGLARLDADPSTMMVLDDTVDERKGKAIEGLGWHHSANSVVQGVCAVTAMLMSGATRLLWAVRGYRTRKSCPDKKDFRSKVALALDILNEARAHFAPGRLTVLMDCWYACAQILNRITQSGWTYVVALRSNRIVRFQGKKRILRNLVKGRRKSAFHTVKISRGRRVHFAVLEIHLPKVGPVRLVICRIGKTAWHYLVTNDLAMKGRQMVLQYLERSWIETLHR